MKTTRLARGILLFIFFTAFMFRSSPSLAQTETHPCILYLAQERETIRNRLAKEPYAGWLNQLMLQADAVLNYNVSWDKNDVLKVTQAYYAKLLAGAYVFTDSTKVNHQTYGIEAAKALAAVPNGSFTTFFSSDLYISEAAVYWGEAYDMLKGENFDFTLGGTTQDLGPVISGRLAKLRAYMSKNNWTDYLNFLSTSIARDFISCVFYDVSHTDNHHVKLQSALVVLSLSILDESGSSGDLNTARSRLMDALGNLTITGDNSEPTGGWAEGPNYHLYSAQQYLPALIALKNMNIFDFTTVTELVETHLWLPRIVMPDGLTPPFNDNEAAYFDLIGLLYSLHQTRPDRDALFWMWNQIGRAVSPMFLPDYLARFDDTPPVHANPGELGWTPTGFYPESGFARFRDSWNNDSIYLQFLSKHGEARINGQAHNHPDPNSFILHAFGNMLLMDSGYGGFAEHDSTRFAHNHNLILVDGDGPPAASQGSGLLNFWQANSSDARLDRYFTDPALDYAHSITQYQSANFDRTVLFPSHRYFFLYDRISGAKNRTFTLLLHGNGGGTSGGTFTSLDSGARWEQDKASVRTFTVGSSPLTFATEDMKHAVYSRSPFLSHMVLEVTQNASEARFLTLLFPERKGAVSPSISAANVSHGKGISLAFDDTTDYGVMHADSTAMTLATGKGSYTTDADCFLGRFGALGKLIGYSVINGTFVTSGQDTLIRSLNPLNLTATYESPNAISGYLQVNVETNITLSGIRTSKVIFQGKEITFSPLSNSVRFTITGEGQFRVEGSTTRVESKPTGFWVGDPFPNPFNPVSQINYFIPEDARVTIAVYTVTGQKITMLKDEVMKAGKYSCSWFTTGIPSGIYFLKVSAGKHSAIKKMALVK